MIDIKHIYKRWAAVVLFAIICVAGIYTVSNRLEYLIEIKQSGSEVIISSIASGSKAESAGLKVGDRILSIANHTIINRNHARWYIRGPTTEIPVNFHIERSGIILDLSVGAEHPFNPGFIIMNALLGVAFLLVGTMVWWPGRHNPRIRSFFTLNSLTGTAIILYSHENMLPSTLLHYSCSFLWFFTYCHLPAALVEFLARFQSAPKPSRLLMRVIYLPPFLIFLLLSYCYIKAYSTSTPPSIIRYETIFGLGFGTLLIIYFIAGILLLLKRYLKPLNQTEKGRIGWLLICTLVGAMPFILLYKLPGILGYEPFVPLWVTFGLMLVIPIGWGMAVASFRMLQLEWVLSRTIVYIITLGLVLILLFGGILLGVNYFELHEPLLLLILFMVGSIITYFLGAGLIEQVRNLVDRIYYRDWFNYRDALLKLGEELSQVIEENAIFHLLTKRLPHILKVEKSQLLWKSSDNFWIIPGGINKHSDEIILNVQNIVDENQPKCVYEIERNPLALSETNLRGFGYRILLPLIHQENIVGILLLGEKVTEAPYSVRDFILLNTISGYAGTALENIRLTHKLLDNEKRSLAVDMAGGIAHEINNALSPLMGQAQLIELMMTKDRDSISPEKLGKSLSVMVEMCRRIKRISANLSRISEPLHLEKVPVSLVKVAEDTLQLLSETAGRIKQYRDDPSARFRLRKQLEESLPSIEADPQQLSQVYMNLIINASDAMESKTEGTLTVGAKLAPDGASVVGFVEDNGQGIPPQLLDKIFQPYFTTKPKGKGTGLGMAIVRSILEAHGGRISIQSIEGVGTRVEFSLPFKNKISDDK